MIRLHSPPPAHEAIIGGTIRAQAFRQVPPRCAGAQDPEDAIEDTAVVYSCYAARFIWQYGLDGGPLIVREFVTHEVKLHLEARNHSLVSDVRLATAISYSRSGARA